MNVIVLPVRQDWSMIQPRAHSMDIYATIVLSQNTLWDRELMETVGVCPGFPRPRLSAAGYGAGFAAQFSLSNQRMSCPQPPSHLTCHQLSYYACGSQVMRECDEMWDRAVRTFVFGLICNAVRTSDKSKGPNARATRCSWESQIGCSNTQGV